MTTEEALKEEIRIFQLNCKECRSYLKKLSKVALNLEKGLQKIEAGSPVPITPAVFKQLDGYHYGVKEYAAYATLNAARYMGMLEAIALYSEVF